METPEKFLEFNGTNILFTTVDGVHHIAIRPICEALKVDVRRSREMVKSDPILGAVVSEQTLQVTKNGISQRRKLTCVPEKYIYGWIFSLRSDNPQLVAYKKSCYNLLYDHFHGTITNRKEILIKRRAIETELAEIQNQLAENSPEFKRIKELEAAKKKLNSQLGVMDKEIIKQPELFEKS